MSAEREYARRYQALMEAQKTDTLQERTAAVLERYRWWCALEAEHGEAFLRRVEHLLKE